MTATKMSQIKSSENENQRSKNKKQEKADRKEMQKKESLREKKETTDSQSVRKNESSSKQKMPFGQHSSKPMQIGLPGMLGGLGGLPIPGLMGAGHLGNPLIMNQMAMAILTK